MKVTAFNGSPRKEGNTSLLIRHAFDALNKEGIATEMVQVGAKNCTAALPATNNKIYSERL